MTIIREQALGNPIQSVTNNAYLAKLRSFEGIAGKQIQVLAGSFSREEVSGARVRGRGLNWRETAERLLQELRELGWAA